MSKAHVPESRPPIYNRLMNETVRRAAGALADDLRGVFGSRLHSLLVYGAAAADASGASRNDSADPRPDPIHTLALVDRVALADLAACAGLAAAWRRRGLAMPLIVPAGEFARSLDAFPLEYGEIIARHAVIAGSSPFEGLGVKPDDVRRACEVQAKSHLLHLREGYIEAGGRPSEVARLVARSAAPFAALLANALRLLGADASTQGE